MSPPPGTTRILLPELLSDLLESRRQLRAVIDSMPAMIGYWDRDLRNVLANHAYVEWFGWAPEQMRGHHIREVIGEKLFALNKPHIDAALAGEEQRFDRTIVDASGRTRYSQAAYVPDVDDDGCVHGFFVLVADVTERVEAEMALATATKELERLALSDPLTGLANRPALELQAHQALAQLDRSPPGERTLALVLLDLDGFKPVNDTYGHAAGDEVLKELGRRLRDEVREPDVVARIGGDEIVVLAPEVAGEAGIERLVQRLKRLVAQPVRLSGGATVRVTASVGVATAGATHPLPTMHQLMRTADERMYAAKASRR